MKNVFKLGVISAAAVLAACAIDPSQCNTMNADAGMVTKARCDMHGGYAHNVQQKQLTLEEEQRLNAMFREVYAAVEKEKSEVLMEYRNKQSEYKQLNTALQNLLGELEKRTDGNKKLEQEIADIKAELLKMESDRDPVMIEKQAELESLRIRVTELEEVFIQ
ncbi:MAG: hypothetical protein VYA55_04145 [Pseudomonadota bacterium]|nr:hypothetical protein [Pseudomonadota bacterium]